MPYDFPMSRVRQEVPAGRLRELLDYDPSTGVLTWKWRPGRAQWNATWAGKLALTAVSAGYRKGNVLRYQVLAHIVIWAWMTGEWPPDDKTVDHRDKNRLNNRWGNLRLATRAQNQRNRNQVGKSSQYHGVTLARYKRKPQTSWKWQAKIMVDGVRLHLGSFSTEIEAALAYNEAAIKHHGEFASINLIVEHL